MQFTMKTCSLEDVDELNIAYWADLYSVCERGYDSDKLSDMVLLHAAECCRSSPTGEGIFVFNSWQNELIYQTVHRASTTIAESVRIARTTSDVGSF